MGQDLMKSVIVGYSHKTPQFLVLKDERFWGAKTKWMTLDPTVTFDLSLDRQLVMITAPASRLKAMGILKK